MKSFNLHDIMNTAWKIRKAAKITMSEALKKAWRIAKAVMMGASIWEKGGKSRLYLNKAGSKLVGLTYGCYNSGSIRWAELNGEEISNAEGCRILTSLTNAYIDLADWTVHAAPSKPEAYQTVKSALSAAFAI